MGVKIKGSANVRVKIRRCVIIVGVKIATQTIVGVKTGSRAIVGAKIGSRAIVGVNIVSCAIVEISLSLAKGPSSASRLALALA